jgi:tRNA-2-methylthio-N6-dimethylallyladenosine synthase
MQQLVEVVERNGLRRHQARVGLVEDVLVEGPSKKNPSVWSGRSRHNNLVHFGPPTDTAERALHAGDLVDVHITGAAPHWLRGEFVQRRKAAPRRRVRIPVAVV